jgi:hypothetical protein
MNTYMSDRIARDHLDQLRSDAVIGRRLREIRKARRAASRSVRIPARAQPTSRARAVVSTVVTRPAAAVHAWLAAGLL